MHNRHQFYLIYPPQLRVRARVRVRVRARARVGVRGRGGVRGRVGVRVRVRVRQQVGTARPQPLRHLGRPVDGDDAGDAQRVVD